jgi:outer membrane protein assembly factor BamE (lipoprotein component of BamABCDE complex)
MNPSLLNLVVAALVLSGCASAGQSYARQHPELPQEQQQILTTGKIPDGDAVSGMTREQIRLAMGMDPTQFTKVNGQDAWVFVQKKPYALGSTVTASGLDRPDNRNRDYMAENAALVPEVRPETKTIIYFQGNRATRAEVVTGGL